ncbi:MAG: glycosyltransferase [Nitrospirota bacterium]
MSDNQTLDISVIVPVVERYDDLHKLYSEFSSAFDKLGRLYEFIFVVDGGFNNAFEDLKKMKLDYPAIEIIRLIRNFGESIALSIGIERAKGKYIFTLSSYFQVEPEGINSIWNGLNKGYDLVVTMRYPRIDSRFNRLQSYIFHFLTWQITSMHFHDISCGLKGMKREVLEEINLYGDLHRFIPILAHKYGFKVKEVKVRQRKEDTGIRIGISSYSRRLLDILTIFFITKFTMKPLRFFGLIGLSLFGMGSITTGYLGIYRLLEFGGIADKPLLLLGVILMVLGIQSLSIGLIGEIIIFTHARTLKEYHIAEYLSNDL